MHKATPRSGLHRLAAQDPAFASPYWAYSWAGGLALARYVLDHPEIVRSRTVLDLGAGSGLVSIAAAKAGAARVIAAEIDRHAATALALNAAENDVVIDIRHADLTGDAAPAVDIVLAGDLFYAADLAERVIRFLDRCVAAGAKVLIGDPWRADLPMARLTEVARYEVFETGSTPKPSAVFTFS
ncbi:class I SAM-dependent methyltransferase [Sphingomonas sp. S2-65]|uniref:class I SAM-dependent methyltransferase n=1 Tax=Sphingomonas sp. S2-65 TaxID=2903960 RepID=UPI001F2E227C|nr:50S ribosomal protein L11 methyltransferase [Sphingomonas sp. S2-65]UYY59054.1 50S ribosomal protein L11 methyltransferase [Sphingomonas sp. S2-65]